MRYTSQVGKYEIVFQPAVCSSAHMMMLYASRNSNGLSLNVVYFIEAKIFLKPQRKLRVTLSLKPSQIVGRKET